MPDSISPSAAETVLENGERKSPHDEPRRLRRVSFNLEGTTVSVIDEEGSSNSLLDRQVRWYGKFEYKAFEAILSKTAKHMRNEPPRPFSYQHVLEHVDHLCHHTTGDVDSLLSSSSMSWRLPLADRQALERLLARGAPVGLERWAVHKLEKHGENRRRQLYKIVQQQRGNNGDDGDDGDENDTSTSMEEECQIVSRPGRLFATAMAQALAEVVRNER